jgi:RNA polymerase subunit RPABC4/transcription elongation factor Spt4
MKVRVLACKRCGHRWIPMVANPVMCPRCHSRYWNKDYSRSDKVLEMNPDLLKEILG